MASWGDFEYLQQKLVRTGCIPNGSKIYWDVRPHHEFPTLEFRFLDVCTRVDGLVRLCLGAHLDLDQQTEPADLARLLDRVRDRTCV